ncbi:hypothetical protein MKW92_033814 [Papaver armeniacum]|nr:hypothetical protein MKW92_033814 [Papaver armeniacum]
MNKLKDIVATLSRPSSLGTFNRVASMSFGSVRNSGGKSTVPARMEATDKDLESKENMMNIAGMFSDTCEEEFTCMLGCNLPSIEVQSQVMSFEELCAKEELEGTSEVTYEEMKLQFLGRVD